MRRSSVNFGGKTCKRTINSSLERGWMVVADGLIGSTCINVFAVFQRQAPAYVGCNKVLKADAAMLCSSQYTVMQVYLFVYTDKISVVLFVTRLPAMDSEARSVGHQVPLRDGSSPARHHRRENDNSPARHHRHESDTSDCSARTATTYTPSSRERDCTKHVSFCVPKPVDNTAVWPAAGETERANSSNNWIGWKAYLAIHERQAESQKPTVDNTAVWPAAGETERANSSKNGNEYVGRQRQAESHNQMYYDTDHGVPFHFRSQQQFNHAYETPRRAHESYRSRPWRAFRGRPPRRGRYGGRWQFRGGRFADSMRTCGRYCCGIPFADAPVQSATSDTVQPAVVQCADVSAEQTRALATNDSPEGSVKYPGGVDVESEVDAVCTAPVPMSNNCWICGRDKNVACHYGRGHIILERVKQREKRDSHAAQKVTDEASIATSDVNFSERTTNEQSTESCALNENADMLKCCNSATDVLTSVVNSEPVSEGVAKCRSTVSIDSAADGQFDDASEAVDVRRYSDFVRGVMVCYRQSVAPQRKMTQNDMSLTNECPTEMSNDMALKQSKNPFVDAKAAYETKVGRVQKDAEGLYCAYEHNHNAQTRTAEPFDKRSVQIQTEQRHVLVDFGLPVGLPLSAVLRVTRCRGTAIQQLVSALEYEYRDKWERGFTAKERANVLGAVYLAAAVRRDDADEITEWTSSLDLSGDTLPDNEEADAHKIRRIIHKARSWAVEGGTDEWQDAKLHPADDSDRTYADDGNSAHVSAMRSMCASADCADDEVHDDDRLQASYLLDVSRVYDADDEPIVLYFSAAYRAVASAQKCKTVSAIRAPTLIAPVSACSDASMRQYVTLWTW